MAIAGMVRYGYAVESDAHRKNFRKSRRFSCIMAKHSENLKLDLSCAKLDSWIRRQAGII